MMESRETHIRDLKADIEYYEEALLSRMCEGETPEALVGPFLCLERRRILLSLLSRGAEPKGEVPSCPECPMQKYCHGD